MSTKFQQLQKRVEILESYCENIGGFLEQCAEEVHGYKPMIAGTGLDVEVANLVGYLRSELEAEKLNTAKAVQAEPEPAQRLTLASAAWRAELEHYRALAIAVCSQLGMKREEIAGDVLHSAVDRVRELQECQATSARGHIRTVEGVAEDLVMENEQLKTKLEQAKVSAAADLATIQGLRRARHFADAEHEALVELAQFAGVRDIDKLYPIDLIKLSTASLKSVMTAHDEDTRKIQELQRRFADRVEWSHTIGASLDALPDSVKDVLGDMTCVPECIQALGKMAEDSELNRTIRESQKAMIRKLDEQVKAQLETIATLKAARNEADKRADYGRRLYEAERDHCARITAVLNDAQILTDLNELPF